MENLKIVILSLFIFAALKAQGKVVGVFYLNIPYGHVHVAPNAHSDSLTNIQCNHPVQVLSKKMKASSWHYVKVGRDRGYIRKKFLSRTKAKCVTDKYSRFLNTLNLDLSDLYYWGKLYDNYLEEYSHAK